MPETLSAEFVRSIDANRTVKDALAAAISSSRPRSRISVTDLVSPMQAFYRRTRPEIRPSPDRLQVMMAGTGFHEIVGPLLSTEEYLEQLLELDGIVGKVDIYEDVPVELKTTSSIPKDIYKGRSSYFEQLGMYCAMANKDTGRLLVYQRRSDEQPDDFRAYQANFTNLGRVVSEMRTRRDAFQDALEHNDPSNLPQCKWLYLGCDYSSVCSCRGKSPDSPIVAQDEVEIVEMPELEEEIKDKLSSAPTPAPTLGLNDLVFPRMAALQRSNAGGESDKESDADRMHELQRQGFRYELYTALRYGSPGQFKQVPVRLDTLVGKVSVYRESPTILRVPRLNDMVQRDRLPSFFSHYFDRLALECALTNIRHGRLILYYEKIPDDKFMVYDVTFHSRDAILVEAKRRLSLLESGAEHTALPPCPAWMARFCDFAPNCGCGNQGMNA